MNIFIRAITELSNKTNLWRKVSFLEMIYQFYNINSCLLLVFLDDFFPLLMNRSFNYDHRYFFLIFSIYDVSWVVNVDLRKLWLFLIAQWFFVSDMLIAKFFQHATNLRMSCNYHIVSLMPFWMTNNELAICLMPRSITKKD